MYLGLISLAVALGALVDHSDALRRDEMPQCVDEVVARLRDVEIEPTIRLILDRTFPPDVAEHDYGKWVGTYELSKSHCQVHMGRLSKALGDLECHRKFIESPEFDDEYTNTILRTTDKHTKFFVLGAAMCVAAEEDLRARMQLQIQPKWADIPEVPLPYAID